MYLQTFPDTGIPILPSHRFLLYCQEIRSSVGTRILGWQHEVPTIPVRGKTINVRTSNLPQYWFCKGLLICCYIAHGFPQKEVEDVEEVEVVEAVPIGITEEGNSNTICLIGRRRRWNNEHQMITNCQFLKMEMRTHPCYRSKCLLHLRGVTEESSLILTTDSGLWTGWQLYFWQ